MIAFVFLLVGLAASIDGLPGDYKKMEDGKLCSGTWTLITSEENCIAAAGLLDLTWAESWSGSGDFPGCLHANDGRNKVYFNKSPTPSTSANNAKFAAICEIEKPASSLKKAGESCGFCECPETDYSAGTCEGGLDCEINPNLPSEGGICKRPKPQTPKLVGQSCGPCCPTCFCPPSFKPEVCQTGLTCETDLNNPGAGGICRRPAQKKKEGETCGSSSSISAGTCEDGLTCQKDSNFPDRNGFCLRPAAPIPPKKLGEDCGPCCANCFCPPNFSHGTCQEGLTCKTDSATPDVGGICALP